MVRVKKGRLYASGPRTARFRRSFIVLPLATLLFILFIARKWNSIDDATRVASTLPKILEDTSSLIARAPTEWMRHQWDNFFTDSLPIDINHASLEQLRAFGFPLSLATRIIERREKWGTFYSPKQLERVWGYPPALTPLLAGRIEAGKAAYFTPTATPFPFNPNSVTGEELKALGFSEKAITMIERFRDKGGKFWKTEDFARLYCVDSACYAFLAPYISLPARQRGYQSYYNPKASPFAFDPNTITAQELKRLGFSSKGAEMIEKYRERGGTFKRKEDFAKLYCVDSACYAQLEPYITLAEARSTKRTDLYYDHTATPFPFDPNTLDAEGLRKLGFSEKAVGMIEKYRSQGGAFRRKEDFAKLYCVDSTCYARLEGYIELAGAAPTKRKNIYYDSTAEPFNFDPNTLSAEGFAKLGFSEKAVGMITRYRERGGRFWRTSDFAELYCVDSATYARLAPYITFE